MVNPIENSNSKNPASGSEAAAKNSVAKKLSSSVLKPPNSQSENSSSNLLNAPSDRRNSVAPTVDNSKLDDLRKTPTPVKDESSSQPVLVTSSPEKMPNSSQTDTTAQVVADYPVDNSSSILLSGQTNFNSANLSKLAVSNSFLVDNAVNSTQLPLEPNAPLSTINSGDGSVISANTTLISDNSSLLQPLSVGSCSIPSYSPIGINPIDQNLYNLAQSDSALNSTYSSVLGPPPIIQVSVNSPTFTLDSQNNLASLKYKNGGGVELENYNSQGKPQKIVINGIGGIATADTFTLQSNGEYTDGSKPPKTLKSIPDANGNFSFTESNKVGQIQTVTVHSQGQAVITDKEGRVIEKIDAQNNVFKFSYKSGSTAPETIQTPHNIYTYDSSTQTYSDSSGDVIKLDSIDKSSGDLTFSYIKEAGVAVSGVTKTFSSDGLATITQGSRVVTERYYNNDPEILNVSYNSPSGPESSSATYDKNGNLSEIQSTEFGTWVKGPSPQLGPPPKGTASVYWQLTAMPKEPYTARFAALVKKEGLKVGSISNSDRQLNSYGEFVLGPAISPVGSTAKEITTAAGTVMTKDASGNVVQTQVESTINSTQSSSSDGKNFKTITTGTFTYTRNPKTEAITGVTFTTTNAADKSSDYSLTLGADGKWLATSGTAPVSNITSVSIDSYTGMPIIESSNQKYVYGNNSFGNLHGYLYSTAKGSSDKIVLANILTGDSPSTWTIDNKVWVNSLSGQEKASIDVFDQNSMSKDLAPDNTVLDKNPVVQNTLKTPDNAKVITNEYGQITQEVIGVHTYNFTYASKNDKQPDSVEIISENPANHSSSTKVYKLSQVEKTFADVKSANVESIQGSITLESNGSFSFKDSSGQLVDALNDGQIITKKTYPNGKTLVTSMSDAYGNKYVYTRDSSGNLTSFSIPNESSQFNLITQGKYMGDFQGSIAGAVVTIKPDQLTVSDNGTLSYIDTQNNRRSYYADGTSTFIKANGESVQFNSFGQVTQLTDGNALNVKIAYNANHQITNIESNKFGNWSSNGEIFTYDSSQSTDIPPFGKLSKGDYVYASLGFDANGNFKLTPLNKSDTSGKQGVGLINKPPTNSNGIFTISAGDGAIATVDSKITGSPITSVEAQAGNNKIQVNYTFKDSNSSQPDGVNIIVNGKSETIPNAQYSLVGVNTDGMPVLQDKNGNVINYGIGNNNIYQYSSQNNLVNSVTNITTNETFTINKKNNTWVSNNGSSLAKMNLYQSDGTVNVVTAKNQLYESYDKYPIQNGGNISQPIFYNYDTSGQNITSIKINNITYTPDSGGSITLNPINNLPEINYTNGNIRQFSKSGDSFETYASSGIRAIYNTNNQVVQTRSININNGQTQIVKFNYPTGSHSADSVAITTYSATGTPISENVPIKLKQSSGFFKNIDEICINSTTGELTLVSQQNNLTYTSNTDGSVVVTNSKNGLVAETISSVSAKGQNYVTHYSYGSNGDLTAVSSPNLGNYQLQGNQWTHNGKPLDGNVSLDSTTGSLTVTNSKGQILEQISASGNQTINNYTNGQYVSTISKDASGHITSISNVNSQSTINLGYDSSGNVNTISVGGITYVKQSGSDTFVSSDNNVAKSFSGNVTVNPTTGQIVITNPTTHDKTVFNSDGSKTTVLGNGATYNTNNTHTQTAIITASGQNYTVDINGNVSTKLPNGNTLTTVGGLDASGGFRPAPGATITETNASGQVIQLQPGSQAYNHALSSVSAAAQSNSSDVVFGNNARYNNVQEQVWATHQVLQVVSDQQQVNNTTPPINLLAGVVQAGDAINNPNFTSVTPVSDASLNNYANNQSSSYGSSNTSDSGYNSDSDSDDSKKKHRKDDGSDKTKDKISTDKSGELNKERLHDTNITYQDVVSHQIISEAYHNAYNLKKGDTFERVLGKDGQFYILGHDKITGTLNYISHNSGTIYTLSSDGKSWINNKGQVFDGSISQMPGGAFMFKHGIESHLASGEHGGKELGSNNSQVSHQASAGQIIAHNGKIEIINPVNGEKLTVVNNHYDITSNHGAVLSKGVAFLEIAKNGSVILSDVKAEKIESGLVHLQNNTIVFIESQANHSAQAHNSQESYHVINANLGSIFHSPSVQEPTLAKSAIGRGAATQFLPESKSAVSKELPHAILNINSHEIKIAESKNDREKDNIQPHVISQRHHFNNSLVANLQHQATQAQAHFSKSAQGSATQAATNNDPANAVVTNSSAVQGTGHTQTTAPATNSHDPNIHNANPQSHLANPTSIVVIPNGEFIHPSNSLSINLSHNTLATNNLNHASNIQLTDLGSIHQSPLNLAKATQALSLSGLNNTFDSVLTASSIGSNGKVTNNQVVLVVGNSSHPSGSVISGAASNTIAGNVVSGNVVAGHQVAGKAGFTNLGTGIAGTGNTGVGTAGTGIAGTGTAGVGTAGTGIAGAGTAGAGTAGTGTAGTGNTGVGTAGTGIAGAGNSAGVLPGTTYISTENKLSYTTLADGSIIVASVDKGSSNYGKVLETVSDVTINGQNSVTHYSYGSNGDLTAITSPSLGNYQLQGNQWTHNGKPLDGNVSLDSSTGSVIVTNSKGQILEQISASGNQTINNYANGQYLSTISKDASGHITSISNLNSQSTINMGYDSSGNVNTISVGGITYVKQIGFDTFVSSDNNVAKSFSGNVTVNPTTGQIVITNPTTHDKTVFNSDGSKTTVLGNGATYNTNNTHTQTAIITASGQNYTVDINGNVSTKLPNGNTLTTVGGLDASGGFRPAPGAAITETNASGQVIQLQPGSQAYNQALSSLSASSQIVYDSNGKYYSDPATFLNTQGLTNLNSDPNNQVANAGSHNNHSTNVNATNNNVPSGSYTTVLNGNTIGYNGTVESNGIINFESGKPIVVYNQTGQVVATYDYGSTQYTQLVNQLSSTSAVSAPSNTTINSMQNNITINSTQTVHSVKVEANKTNSIEQTSTVVNNISSQSIDSYLNSQIQANESKNIVQYNSHEHSAPIHKQEIDALLAQNTAQIISNINNEISVHHNGSHHVKHESTVESSIVHATHHETHHAHNNNERVIPVEPLTSLQLSSQNNNSQVNNSSNVESVSSQIVNNNSNDDGSNYQLADNSFSNSSNDNNNSNVISPNIDKQFNNDNVKNLDNNIESNYPEVSSQSNVQSNSTYNNDNVQYNQNNQVDSLANSTGNLNVTTDVNNVDQQANNNIAALNSSESELKDEKSTNAEIKHLTDINYTVMAGNSHIGSNPISGNSGQSGSKNENNNLSNYQQRYVVKQSDTLENIAIKMFRDKSVTELIYNINKNSIDIKVVNGVTKYVLRPGSVLILPSIRQVRQWKVMQKLGGNNNNTNNLNTQSSTASTSNSLVTNPLTKEIATGIGFIDKLINSLDSNSQTNTINVNTNFENRLTFKVRLGDTLRSIAAKHPTLNDVNLWRLIAKLNNLTDKTDLQGNPIEVISRGMMLILPNSDDIEQFYNQSKLPTPKTHSFPSVDKKCLSCNVLIAVEQSHCQKCLEALSQVDTDPSLNNFNDVQTYPDTIVDISPNLSKEIKSLSDNCRLVKFSDNNQSIEKFMLETLSDSKWFPVLIYEVSGNVSKRYEINVKGQKINSLNIELPLGATKQMIQYDLKNNWKEYVKNYSSRLNP